MLDGLVPGPPCVRASNLRQITAQIILLAVLGTGDVFLHELSDLSHSQLFLYRWHLLKHVILQSGISMMWPCEESNYPRVLICIWIWIYLKRKCSTEYEYIFLPNVKYLNIFDIILLNNRILSNVFETVQTKSSWFSII